MAITTVRTQSDKPGVYGSANQFSNQFNKTFFSISQRVHQLSLTGVTVCLARLPVDSDTEPSVTFKTLFF